MTSQVMGKALPRIDGRAKVTGAARYAADFNRPGQLYAVIVPATIGLGRIASIDLGSDGATPGITVISHLNAPRLAYRPHKAGIDPAVGERLHVFQDDAVRFYGQPVAVVVADSFDEAERAAAALHVRYVAEPPLVDLASPDAARFSLKPPRAPAPVSGQTAPAATPMQHSPAPRCVSTSATKWRARTTIRWNRMPRLRSGRAIG